ncbi:MAG: FCD domain-containing protein [Magnetospirillum sp.]|nr:FCD domain-containing protein [Magnetospirillum sp.]
MIGSSCAGDARAARFDRTPLAGGTGRRRPAWPHRCRGLAGGGRIPPEAELVRQLGVSRNTLREAVRCLAHAGMLEVRQGDGTYVRAAADGGETLRKIARTSLRDQIEVRCALEETAARLAASRCSEAELTALADLRDMADAVDRMEAVDEYIRHDFAFHCGIVAAAGNPALEELYLYFATAVRISIRRSIGDADLPEPGPEQHRAVLEALARRDPDGAARATRALFAPLLAALDTLLEH